MYPDRTICQPLDSCSSELVL